MAFRIQDLMTDVSPDAIRWASCPGGTTCGGGAFEAASNTGKGDKSPKCRPPSRGGDSPRPRPRPRPGQDYTDLTLLHRQLHQALTSPQPLS